ncbi:hypothetical protein BGZ51_009392 [Haplosporangium sp. Z 767]|nr:hypothetical protein BGZ51_009392 [Haplosporangium sp. Z 767]KAF9196048.1 hypothetical protein BGZ50_002305 [Haplosporangium sp. Z 11]
MLQPPAISIPQSASASPSSRAPRQNRKSGIAAALQSQNKSQHQNQSQNGNSTNTKNNSINNTSVNNNNATNLNGNARNNNRQPRNPAQTHSRHQSMPSNTKGNNGGVSITVLKRSSASVATPTPTSSSAVSGIQILQNQQNKQQQQQQHQQYQQHRNQKPRPRSQNNIPSSKAKRALRRKDIEATTESLADADQDAIDQSPPMNPSSPPSSTDSEDSESAVLQSKPHARSPRGSNNSSNNKQNGRSSKGFGQLAVGPLQRPNSAPVVPQLRKGMTTPQRHQSDAQGSHQQFGNRKPSFGSASALPLDMTDSQLRPNMSKVNSADKIMLADRVNTDKKSTLYAGPTFHNSPAPTSLPIPAFARSWSNTPIESAVEKLPPSPFFAEAASPQLNSMRPQRTQSETGGWMAHNSMPGILPHHASIGVNYHLPERMATSSYSLDMPTMHEADHLMEISQNLRNLLKIQSQ